MPSKGTTPLADGLHAYRTGLNVPNRGVDAANARLTEVRPAS